MVNLYTQQNLNCDHNWIVDRTWEGFNTQGVKVKGIVIRCNLCMQEKKLDLEKAKMEAPQSTLEPGDFFKKGQIY